MQPVVIKRERVSLSEERRAPLRAGSPHAAGSHLPGAPVVRTIEHEGQIVALELTCSCGETSLVELRYPSEALVPQRAQVTPAQVTSASTTEPRP